MGKIEPAIASYVTLKELYDAKEYKSQYQILAEYIKYIICNEKLFKFSIQEIKNKLNSEFGFDLPNAVIATSLKGINGVTRKSNEFSVDDSLLTDSVVFTRAKEESDCIYKRLVESLLAFLNDYYREASIKKDEAIKAFHSFLTDKIINDKSYAKHKEAIGTFIMRSEENESLKNQLEAVREGFILYTGLNYNMSSLGSVNNDLSIYLDTEILFSLLGYNGNVYECLTQDLYKQIQKANSRERKINLFYFSDVKDEIYSVFNAAESIVKGKTVPIYSVAIKRIIEGCKTPSDVREKLSDFFLDLSNKYGILEDANNNYYSEEQYSLNLEKSEGIEDEEVFSSRKQISNINKLRRGRTYKEYLDSKFLLVTETSLTLDMSNEMSPKGGCGFAVSTSLLTNLLWYKMGNGFGGEEYPRNVDAALKARTVLSGIISQKVSELYESTLQDYRDEKITNETVASRLVLLKSKITTPEELSNDNVKDLLDFSDEYLASFEEGIESTKRELECQQEEISELKKLVEYYKTKSENTQKELGSVIAKREMENAAQKNELEKYKKRETEQNEKKARRRQIIGFILSISWKILLLSALFIGLLFFCKRIDSVLFDAITLFLGIIGTCGALFAIFRSGYRKFFGKE